MLALAGGVPDYRLIGPYCAARPATFVCTFVHDHGGDHAGAVRASLPRAPEYHLVAGAGHVDFIAPCTNEMANQSPLVCAEHGGFDRAAFHRTFDAAVVAFFERTLGH